MGNEKLVSISNMNDEGNRFIIKDLNDIIVGRFSILDLEEENKSILIKLKFYKSSDESKVLLQEALKFILDNLIKEKKIHKVNIICEDNINLSPFESLGFQLEGYLSDCQIVNSKYEGKLLLGIVDIDYYNNFYKKEVFFNGNNISIKVLSAEDGEDLLNYYIRNKKFLSVYEPRREENFYTLEVQKQSLIENYKEFIKGEGVHFGIFKDKMLIGRIRISNVIHGVFKSAFIGYSIDENYQGKGYMKEAVGLVLDYAYNELDLHRVEATTLLDNDRSKGVLKACGFSELGVCKDYLYINGKWRDHVIFYRNKI